MPQTIMYLAPGHWAGHTRIYHRQCLHLIEEGYQVELVAHPLPNEQLDSRLKLHSLGLYNQSSLSLNFLQRLRRCRKAYAIAKESICLLYQYFSPEFIVWGRKLRMNKNRPIVFDCMEDFEGYARQRRGIPRNLRWFFVALVKLLMRIAGNSCDALITADNGTAELLRPYARRLLVIHNFPKIRSFPKIEEMNRYKPYDIIYHGSMPRYHLEIFLNVDEALVERGYYVKWLLIGQMPEESWFINELEKRGIKQRFTMNRMIPHEQVLGEVSKAKIGIIPLPDLPKFRHNIPQKLFEFMALGMPVVLSDLPPSRPFVGDGACAFMVPPGSYTAYADALVRLLEDQELCHRMGIEGRKRIEKEFNWEKESKKLDELYAELLKI